MKVFCVISHTHWDREWYMPLERFRLKLVDLMDRCLETLDKNPTYIFHLDAQTIVLEDYLSVRPGKRGLLKKHIGEGRLIVGPWYLQNDFYLTSGEATVRNLLEGHELANEFGACSKTGYVPDQFGNISQLPQILKNFGIDNVIFGRGLSAQKEGKTVPSELIWRGADGTEALGIHMRFWYNNAQRFSADIDKAKLLVDTVEKQFEGVAVTPYLLLMNGVDHLEAQDDLLPILGEVNKRLDGKTVKQYILSDYIDNVRKYIYDNNIDMFLHEGELREGGDWSVLKGTLSSRSRLKILNVKAQTMLENRLEPLCGMMELAGAEGMFSHDHFRYMWKELMKNHPHDSICGCSHDEVHAHMLDNYWRLFATSNDMWERGMTFIATHLGISGVTENDYVIAVANTTQKTRSGVCELTIDIRRDDKFGGIEIVDGGGKKAEYVITDRRGAIHDGFSPLNLPGNFPVDRYTVSLYAEDVAAFGVKGYLIKSISDCAVNAPDNGGEAVMENEYIKVTVSQSGSVDLLYKENGRLFTDVLDIEDVGDRGDSYIYGSGGGLVRGGEFEAKVSVSDNALIKEISIERDLRLPRGYDFTDNKRTDDTTVTKVIIILRLSKSGRHLEIGFTVDNQSENHRLRLLVKTGIEGECSVADSPFDVIKRSQRDIEEHTTSRVFPNSTFALLEDAGGFAVLTEGMHEYEHIENGGVLAFTLVRANGAISAGSGGDQWQVPGNQCIGITSGRLALYPYKDDYISADVVGESVFFRAGLQAYAVSYDIRKLTEGRTAVQDTRLEEFFYYDDPHAGVAIPDNVSLLNVSGSGVLVTALKKAQCGGGLILRAVNLMDDSCTFTVNAGERKVMDTNMYEESLNTESSETHELRTKEIKSLRIL